MQSCGVIITNVPSHLRKATIINSQIGLLFKDLCNICQLLPPQETNNFKILIFQKKTFLLSQGNLVSEVGYEIYPWPSGWGLITVDGFFFQSKIKSWILQLKRTLNIRWLEVILTLANSNDGAQMFVMTIVDFSLCKWGSNTCLVAKATMTLFEKPHQTYIIHSTWW